MPLMTCPLESMGTPPVKPELSLISGSPFPILPAVQLSWPVVEAMAIDPTGRFLYAGSGAGFSGIASFSIDSSSGALTATGEDCRRHSMFRYYRRSRKKKLKPMRDKRVLRKSKISSTRLRKSAFSNGEMLAQGSSSLAAELRNRVALRG